MVILLWNFYDEAIIYSPFGAIENAVQAAGGTEGLASRKQGPAWGEAITEKNLFSQRRGVYVPPPPPPVYVPLEKPKPAPKRPALGLKGVIQDEYGEYVALIEKDGARPVPLRKGDVLDDVVVVYVDQRNVTLRWNEEDIKLSMEKIRTLKR